MRLPVLLLLLVLAVSLPVVFSGRDSQGTEFILGFMEHEGKSDIALYISTISNTPAVVTVTTPLFDRGWTSTRTVSRGNVEIVTVPHTIRGEGVEKSNKGLFVQSTVEISVLAVNVEATSTDPYMALPVDVLGTEYYAITFLNKPELLIVATEDNTAVSIQWSRQTTRQEVSIEFEGVTYSTHGAALNLTLNKFQTFHAVQQDGQEAEFIGTHITSDKPIAVTSGNKKWFESPQGRLMNQLMEMLLPVDTWGTSFVTFGPPGRGYSGGYACLASEDETKIYVSGKLSSNLRTARSFGKVTIFETTAGTYEKVTSNKPILMMMVTVVWNNGRIKAVSSGTSTIPEAQYTSDYTWSSLSIKTGSFNNMVVVVIEEKEKAGLQLDRQNVTWDEEDSINDSTAVRLLKYVTPGSHNIYHINPLVTFGVYVFGTRNSDIYAFPGGMRMAPINTVCIASSIQEGDGVDNDCDGKIDEEALNDLDDDGDGSIDEDLVQPREDGQWGSWNPWEPCSVSYGNQSVTTRTRVCNNPAPVNYGFFCTGSSLQAILCPVDGQWGSWSSWGPCSVSCGRRGVKLRTRECNDPAPANNGLDCQGSCAQAAMCRPGPCPRTEQNRTCDLTSAHVDTFANIPGFFNYRCLFKAATLNNFKILRSHTLTVAIFVAYKDAVGVELCVSEVVVVIREISLHPALTVSTFSVSAQTIRDVFSGKTTILNPEDLWTIDDKGGYMRYLCFGYNNDDGQVSFSIRTRKDRCTQVLTFRPIIPDFSGDAELVITANARVSHHRSVQFPNTLCSGRHDRAFDRSFMGLESVQQKILYALLDQNVEQPKSDTHCVAAVQAFHNLNKEEKKKAAERCDMTPLNHLADCIRNRIML